LFKFHNIEALREKFCNVFKKYLEGGLSLRNCIPGEEFRFLSSRIFILPTPFFAKDLKEFALCLEKVTIHSIYFHVFEARLRLKKPDNDFSCWLRGIGFLSLASKISRLDPYTYTLEGLRKKMIILVKNNIKI